jgi:hypothetical protein
VVWKFVQCVVWISTQMEAHWELVGDALRALCETFEMTWLKLDGCGAVAKMVICVKYRRTGEIDQGQLLKNDNLYSYSDIAVTTSISNVLVDLNKTSKSFSSTNS